MHLVNFSSYIILLCLPNLALGRIIRTKVVILGAGMSGIGAAKTLAQKHDIQDIVIVDGQKFIGGRLHDVEFAGTHVEVGANWVQGLGENPLWALAQTYELKTVYSNYSDIAYFTENGRSNFEAESDEYNNAFVAMQALAGKKQSTHDADISARSALEMVGWNPDTPAKQAIEYFNFDWELGESADLSSLIWSVNNYNFTFNNFSPDNNFVIDKRGFKWIPESVAGSFLKKNDSRLLLDTIVKKVIYSNRKVFVLTNKGDTIIADYAISTFSLGVLQNRDVQFLPEFPSWKLESIYNFHMITYTKIFLNFDYQFWSDEQYYVYADPTRRGYFTIWQNLNAPGFLPKNTKTNILMVTVTDAESKRIELQDDMATQKEALAVLRKMFGHNVPAPNAILVPRWHQNPLFRGSYSNWPSGELREQHDKLRAPIGRLWFTGEACSSDYFGFAHGAWIEGVRVGEEIAECLKYGRCIYKNKPTYPTLKKCPENEKAEFN